MSRCERQKERVIPTAEASAWAARTLPVHLRPNFPEKVRACTFQAISSGCTHFPALYSSFDIHFQLSLVEALLS